MAKPELGTKRVDPETGKKFYDLNKDPIVSPYTGTSYPRSVFEAPPERVRGAAARAAPAPEVEEEDPEAAAVEEREEDVISLEEVEEDPEKVGDPSVDEDETAIVDSDALEIEAEIEGDDEVPAPFLDEEEEEGDDVVSLLDVNAEDEDEV